MQRQPDGTWLYSPKDLISWLEGDFAAWCERNLAEHRVAGRADESPVHPDSGDDELEIAVRYGLQHERAHLERLRERHPDLVEIPDDAPDRHGATLGAMRSGAPVIFQGVLAAGNWGGIADFLHRIDQPSTLGDWAYEPWDTKLARTARPYFLLQLCAYADLLQQIQGHLPARVGFVLGDQTEAHFRTDDFWHYFDRLRRRFLEFQQNWNGSTPPDPGADRSHGRWSEAAAKMLEQRDDLSLIAGIARPQVIRLREAGIVTVAQLAQQPVDKVPRGISAAAFARLREQAAMQVQTRETGKLAWRVRDKGVDYRTRGLALLPLPSRLDVFYDIEGFPYAEDGLEYLHGATTIEPDGALRFHDWWAHDEASEKRAFEQFVDWAWQRWQADPSMHIYHYAGYERTALSRLSIKYASREFEIDQFLRNGVLVDLFTVVRQGLVIGAPSYSLKEIEKLYLAPRDGDVVSAVGSVVEYQRWIDSGEPPDWRQSPILSAIRDYNRVDCESTAYLRDWLLERQREADWQWQPPDTGDESSGVVEREKGPRELLAERLTASAESRDGEQRRVTQLLAWLLEYHRRDDKPMWWRYFERLSKDENELYDDPDCLAGLVRTETAPWPDKRSLVYEFRFDPEQETTLHEGSSVNLIGPGTSRATINTMDPIAGLLTITRGVGRDMPTWCHLIPDEHVSAKPIAESIERYVRAWEAGEKPSQAIDDLLHRRSPRIRGRSDDGAPLVVGDDLVSETTRIVRAMDNTVLAIQGPPGTGKTHTAAHVIAALLDDGKRIGVVASSHAVVGNLLAKVRDVASHHVDRLYKVGAENTPDDVQCLRDSGKVIDRLDQPVVVGGTAWVFSRPELQQQFDYLFVDEAGQMSLANTIGAGMAARNLVLVGDQMQLAQVVQGVHPGESGLSCLEYFLHGHQTVPPHLGVLLNRSYRMHPDLCRFISDAYYEGRLQSDPCTYNNRIDWNGPATGMHFVPVDHEGRAQSSEEEVEQVRTLVDQLLGRPMIAGDREGTVQLEDILVVAPFNAQVRALIQALPAGMRVGTVDRFQGQQAPIVIVSMSASSLDDAPRGAGFLLSPNRLNVALSRAQALAIVVASPRLGDVRVRSVAEMRLVNGWCRVDSGAVMYDGRSPWRHAEGEPS